MPPSSSCAGFICRAQAAATERPALRPPVSETAAMRSSRTIAANVSPAPCSNWKTPGGRPSPATAPGDDLAGDRRPLRRFEHHRAPPPPRRLRACGTQCRTAHSRDSRSRRGRAAAVRQGSRPLCGPSSPPTRASPPRGTIPDTPPRSTACARPARRSSARRSPPCLQRAFRARRRSRPESRRAVHPPCEPTSPRDAPRGRCESRSRPVRATSEPAGTAVLRYSNRIRCAAMLRRARAIRPPRSCAARRRCSHVQRAATPNCACSSSEISICAAIRRPRSAGKACTSAMAESRRARA